MESLIKSLLFASIGLFSYGAQASMLEGTNNVPYHNDQIIAWLNTANHSKASNFYASSNSLRSGALVLIYQLPNSKQTNWAYNTLAKSNKTYNPDNNNDFISKNQSTMRSLKDDLVAACEFSMERGIEASNEIICDVPLPTATWLFLGALLGILRIQRRKELR